MLAACTPSQGGSVAATGSPATAANQVEVVTWWASGSEKLALDTLVTAFGTQHPGVAFRDGSVAGGAGSSAIDLLRSRFASGDSPDTFQAHAGAEIRDYVDAGQVQDLTGLYDDLGLRDVFPARLLDLLRVDGKLYAVPLDIHRANVVWANRSVLTHAGLDPDATYPTLASWITALGALKAAGVHAPLSLATTWAQVQLLETVLLADLGAPAYDGLWDGSTPWDGAPVTRALQDFATLLTFTNTDRDSLDWSASTQRVIDGTSAFTVMGDWALVAFDDAQRTQGLDYSTFPVPGTAGVFDLLADTFTLSTGAPDPAAAKSWLATVSSTTGQTSFSIAKGSIPARSDISATFFSPYQRDAMVSFVSDTLVPSLAHGAAAPLAVVNAISTATQAFTGGSTTVAQLQAALVAAAQPAAG